MLRELMAAVTRTTQYDAAGTAVAVATSEAPELTTLTVAQVTAGAAGDAARDATTDAATAGSPALRLDAVRAGYAERLVLDGVTARLDRGQTVALLGPNGSGKSTLLKIILGLLVPMAGHVEVYGARPERLDRRRYQIGYMPQLRDVDRAFPATALDLVAMGRIGRLGLLRRPSGRDRAIVRQALDRVGLLGLAGRQFSALSGGQQQRVFLARALAQEPDLLVLDEPAAGVDDENRARIGTLLTCLRAEGVPMLVATHDLDELAPFTFDRHWRLNLGRLLDEPSSPDHVHPHAHTCTGAGDEAIHAAPARSCYQQTRCHAPFVGQGLGHSVGHSVGQGTPGSHTADRSAPDYRAHR
ncbi:MAG: metal ABC transporter ATP-binding protein [Chloroflexi bacterium]|nr:metal ABC transporter ATP-binding protein [Chloroflexota bacterium]